MKAVFALIFLLSLFLLACAQDQDIIDITKIPAFPQDYKTKLRAGYLNVSPYNQYFYYILAESQSKPLTDPLILWLNGGPACSSLIGFFSQNGPFMFKKDDPTTMVLNPYRWNKKASVLYLQSPGGVGFSKAITSYLVQNDTSVSKDNLIALILFFSKYKQYQGNDFYLAGQDYAGIYVPQLARLILDYNEQMQEIHFNLMGFLLGNACTKRQECTTPKYYSRFTTEYLFTRGFIDQNQWNEYRTRCLSTNSSETTDGCVGVQKNIYNDFMYSNASLYNIYGNCAFNVLPKGEVQPQRCQDSVGMTLLLNNNDLRAQFKVDERKNSTLYWKPCSQTVIYTKQNDASYGLLQDLTKAGLRIFYYTGDFDANVPITGTVAWFDLFRADFGKAVKRSWRPWITQNQIFPKNQNISGMVWELDSLTLATVRGAGQMVPKDRPAEAEEILNVFLDSERGWTYPDYYMQ